MSDAALPLGMSRGMSSLSYGALLEGSIPDSRGIGVQGADRAPDVLLADYALPCRRRPMRGPRHVAAFGRQVRRTGHYVSQHDNDN